MFLILGAFLVIVLLAALVVGAIVSMGLGLGLAVHPRTRFVTPLFTLIIPGSLFGAFAGLVWLPPLGLDDGLFDAAVKLVIGGALGLCAGALIASLSWFVAWYCRADRSKLSDNPRKPAPTGLIDRDP